LYSISAMHSSKCLDVEGAALGNGVPVNQYDCHGGTNQQWLFTPVGDGYYKITARHSGRSLDVRWAWLNNGAPVQQYWFANGANQKWKLTPLVACP
jgi:glucosylceramidase